MRQLLRILLAAVGILAVVAVAAVVYVTTFLDPEDFKPRLTEVVEEQTGLTLSLDGALSWSFYPRLGMSVEKASAWLPGQSVDDAEFAAIERAEVSVAFAPLLRGDIAVDGLILDGMRLNLKRNPAGERNWAPLLERLSEGEGQPGDVLAPASAGPHVEAGNLDVVLNIASVQIKDASIHFEDAKADEMWRLAHLAITGRNVNPLRSFPLEATFTLEYHDSLKAATLERTPDVTSAIRLDTQVQLALAEQRFMLENPELSTTTRLTAQSEPQQIDLNAATLEAGLNDRRLTVTEGVLEAALHHPENWKGALALSLAFGLESDWVAQSATLNALELTGPDGLRMRGHLNVTPLSEAPRYQGQLTVSPFDLRPWLKRAGVTLATRSESALSDVAFTSPVAGDMQQLTLPDLSLVLDDTTLTGTLAVALDGTRLGFDLEGDTLDLDRYLPARVPEAQASLGVLRRAFADDDAGALLPREWLSTLTLEATLGLETLTLAGLTFDTPRLTLEGERGAHRLSAFESGLYNGELSATGGVDSRETPIQWALEPRVSGVEVAPLIEAFSADLSSADSSPLRGQLNVDGELASRGNTRDALVRHLKGSLDASLSDGAIRGINISRAMCELAATLERETTSREWHSDTRFDRFDATFMIHDGVVESDDLHISLPGIDVQSDGQLDLGSLRFDALAAIRVVNTADAACDVNPRLEQIALPVRCEGHVSDARSTWCRFDREAFHARLAELLSREAGSHIQDTLEGRLSDALEDLDERLDEEASQALSKELRDGLRRLFE